MSWIVGNFRVLLITWLMFSFGFGVYGNYFQLFLRGLGASDVEIGLGFSVFFAASVLGLVAGYALSDVYGRANVVRKATFLVSLPPLLYALSQDYRVVILFMGVEGFFAFYHPALLALSQDSMPTLHAGKGFALSQLTVIASVPAPLIGGYFYASQGISGLRYAMVVTFLIAISASVYRYYRLKETLSTKTTNPTTFTRTISRSFTDFPASFRLLSSSMILLLLSALTLNLAARALITVGPLYLLDYSVVDKSLIGFFISTAQVIASFLALMVGRFLDRSRKPQRIATVTYLLIPLSAVLFLLSKNPLSIFPAILLSVGGLGFYLHDFYKLRLFPADSRANLNALFLFAIEVSGVAASALGGFLYTLSTTLLFVFAGIAFLGSAGFFARMALSRRIVTA